MPQQGELVVRHGPSHGCRWRCARRQAEVRQVTGRGGPRITPGKCLLTRVPAIHPGQNALLVIGVLAELIDLVLWVQCGFLWTSDCRLP